MPWLASGIFLGMPCIGGHYWDAGISPVRSTPTPVTKMCLMSPLHWHTFLPGHSPPSWDDCCCRGDHLSLPARYQNLHTDKSLEMSLKLRKGRLQLSLFMKGWHCMGRSWHPWLCCEYWPPQSHLIPPLVPQRRFEVLWLPLSRCSSAAEPLMPSWHLTSLWTLQPPQGHELTVSLMVYLSPCNAGSFPLNNALLLRILAPGGTLKHSYEIVVLMMNS